MLNTLVNVKYTKDIVKDTSYIIEKSKEQAYRSINISLIERNWLLGYRIVNEELDGRSRAKYGDMTIEKLSKILTDKYGKGYSISDLRRYCQFYKLYPKIFATPWRKLDTSLTKTNNLKIRATMSRELDTLLTWSHYRELIKIEDPVVREWYEKEAYDNTWDVRTLKRNISSQYYYRVLKNQNIKSIPNDKELYKEEFIKNPIITEFLDIPNTYDFKESDLEKSIINNLQKFMIELGKGYAFVGRQFHLRLNSDYYIDLVFYNYILKCFVLIDLKTTKISHQDVGQMDMYIKMFDQIKKNEDDNPTIGIILCSDTDEDVMRYSILNDNNNLYASKYKLYLPDELELKRELITFKSIYDIQKEIIS